MDDYYEIRVEPDPRSGRISFSKTEMRDITISVLVLALAFGLLYSRNSSILAYFKYYVGDGAVQYAGLFGLSLVLVVVSFLFHEFGHKFVAQKSGLWSEFRMSLPGLFLTIVTSFCGFLFAAPGAVCIAGNADKRTNGLISIAGPMVNVVMSVIGIAGCLLTNHSMYVMFFFLLANLNAFLALFNMLPVPPLDGSKIIRWNPVIWAAAIAMAAAELVYLRMFIPPLYWA